MKFSFRAASVAALAAPILALSSPVYAEPFVTLHTNLGAIELELDQEKAPKTVANFLQYVKAGHYSNTLFHRVIDGFMIQGGGYDLQMREKVTRPPIINEAANGLKNDLGTIAMARTNQPHSATSQFFINVADNPFLDPNGSNHGYAVFGRVTKGMEVVQKIAKVPTRRFQGHHDVPAQAVVIERISIKAK